MNQRAIIVAVVLFVLIVAGMFAFALLKRADLAREVPVPVITEPVGDELTPLRVDAKHFFLDGTHTVVGEIAMPTPCDLLDTNAVVLESFPERVIISFDVINNSDTCIQVITPQRFKVSFDASEEAQIEAVMRGEPVILNFIEAGDGETPDDFELFIKG